MDYIAVDIGLEAAQEADLLVGLLSGAGFEGFEEIPGGLVAWMPETAFGGEKWLRALLGERSFKLRREPPRNWNAFWESHFEPVSVDDFCGIRAAFHAPLYGVTHELVITPRMAFGTGHHATTVSMIRLMRGLNLEGKRVLDFGTGTGVLALLAAKMGAVEVLAVDHDAVAVENAQDNARANALAGLHCLHADRPSPDWGLFDLVLANVNRQVLLAQMGPLAAALRPGGQLLLSGILEADRALLEAAAQQAGLRQAGSLCRDGWLSMAWNTVV